MSTRCRCSSRDFVSRQFLSSVEPTSMMSPMQLRGMVLTVSRMVPFHGESTAQHRLCVKSGHLSRRSNKDGVEE